MLILSMILSQRRQYISSCYSCTLSAASASQFTEPAIHKMSVWQCTPRQQHVISKPFFTAALAGGLGRSMEGVLSCGFLTEGRCATSKGMRHPWAPGMAKWGAEQRCHRLSASPFRPLSDESSFYAAAPLGARRRRPRAGARVIWPLSPRGLFGGRRRSPGSIHLGSTWLGCGGCEVLLTSLGSARPRAVCTICCSDAALWHMFCRCCRGFLVIQWLPRLLDGIISITILTIIIIIIVVLSVLS